MSNSHETWWKWLAHESIIFTKFHEDWKKCEFFTIGQFLNMGPFFVPGLTCQSNVNISNWLNINSISSTLLLISNVLCWYPVSHQELTLLCMTLNVHNDKTLFWQLNLSCILQKNETSCPLFHVYNGTSRLLCIRIVIKNAKGKICKMICYF